MFKKNILIFSGGYYPATSYGGPPVSIQNIVKNLYKDFNFYIVTNSKELNGQAISGIEPNKINYGKYNEKILYLDKDKFRIKYITQMFPIKFSHVYVNSFFGIKQLLCSLKIANKFQIPLLIAPRGELEQNSLKIKKYKKVIYLFIFNKLIKYFRLNSIFFQATTKEEKNSILTNINIDKEQVCVLENIPTTLSKLISHQKKKINYLKICYISRIQTKKNLTYALKTLNHIPHSINICFDIYGPIENINYWKECLEIIKTIPNNIKVLYKGEIKHEDVIQYFSKYDLFYFPTLSENFGHVIYESLSGGCPVLISDQTPWNDINNTDAGRAISLNNPNLFINYIEILAGFSEIEYSEIRRSIKKYLNQKINIENIVDSYIKYFKYDS